VGGRLGGLWWGVGGGHLLSPKYLLMQSRRCTPPARTAQPTWRNGCRAHRRDEIVRPQCEQLPSPIFRRPFTNQRGRLCRHGERPAPPASLASRPSIAAPPRRRRRGRQCRRADKGVKDHDAVRARLSQRSEGAHSRRGDRSIASLRATGGAGRGAYCRPLGEVAVDFVRVPPNRATAVVRGSSGLERNGG